MVADAWDRTTNSSLKKSFKKLWQAICCVNEMANGDLVQVVVDDPLGMLEKLNVCADMDTEDVSE